MKNMNSSEFTEDIQSNIAITDEGLSLDEMVDDYNKANGLELHETAPLKTKGMHVNCQPP